MTGAVAANLHEGSRSELLADYLFSTWGTVSPVRRQDDYGIDMYCTLTARAGQRAVVTDHFAVQVKSTTDPWVFSDEASVRWLVEHPTPLFLACVDKAAVILRVYQVTPRFYVWAMGKLPGRLELRPDDTDAGAFVPWEGGETFSLSAPILRVTIADFMNRAAMNKLRDVLECWVRFDRDNCDLVRQGLLRFRMPYEYRVNQLPPGSIGELGSAAPEHSFLRRGILTAAEGAECIGGQLGRSGDLQAALYAALFVDHLQRTHPDAFAGVLRWRHRLPGDIGQIVCGGLNRALSDAADPPYMYRGIEAVTTSLASDPLVARYLEKR